MNTSFAVTASTSGALSSAASHARNTHQPFGSPKKNTEQKELAYQFKRSSEVGNVPFSQTKRGPHDDARDRNNTLTKTSFAWKTPSVMK